MQLADRVRIEAPRLRERLEHVRAHPPPPPTERRPRQREVPTEYDGDPGLLREPDGGSEWDSEPEGSRPVVYRAGPGLDALKLAVHRPEEIAGRIHEVLFVDEVQRQAFCALVEHDSLHDAIAASSPDVAALLRRATVDEPVVGDPNLDPVDSVVTVLVRSAVRRALGNVEIEARSLDGSWQTNAAETTQVRLWLEELDEPASGRAAFERLVAWLSEKEKNEA
jgi:hypothetical protein